MGVTGDNTEILALVEDAVEVVSVANTTCMFVVQEDGGAVVRADLVERMPGEPVVAHDRLVAQSLERVLHVVEVSLELALRRILPTFQQFLALLRVDGRCYWQVTPPGFTSD